MASFEMVGEWLIAWFYFTSLFAVDPSLICRILLRLHFVSPPFGGWSIHYRHGSSVVVNPFFRRFWQGFSSLAVARSARFG
ncbi:hypothetical protein, partial [Mycolicibacterium mageritense]|uniref:hypothetical protein n=1 Tax=Mycolicibacterium mageritense TaxID=53462 RepID=UPI001E3FA19D